MNSLSELRNENLHPSGFQHTSLPSLKASVHALLKILSPAQDGDSNPVSYLKDKKTERNLKMFKRYQSGDTLAAIANDYGISIARVHQIVSQQN